MEIIIAVLELITAVLEGTSVIISVRNKDTDSSNSINKSRTPKSRKAKCIEKLSFWVLIIIALCAMVFSTTSIYEYLLIFDIVIIGILITTTALIIRGLLQNKIPKQPFKKIPWFSRTTVILITPIVVTCVYFYITYCAEINTAGTQFMDYVEQNNLGFCQTICYLCSSNDKLPNIFIFMLNIDIQISVSALVVLMQISLLLRNKVKCKIINGILDKLLNLWYAPIILSSFPIVALVLRNLFFL